MAKDERNIAILFPGLGYTCDRSLLYYSGKLMQSLNCEVIRLSYSGFPVIEKGDEAEMRKCFAIALGQTEEQLKEIDFSEFEDVLFIGKSIGTAVALQYAQEHGVDARFVLLTPLEQTLEIAGSNQAIAFHGTADPWARTDAIISACKSKSIPLYLTEGANHSLETGNVSKDIDNLQKVMRRIREFAGETIPD